MMNDRDPWSIFSRQQMEDHDNAVELLALGLGGGHLALLLGAGISMPLGLPNWADLVDRAGRLLGTDAVELANAVGSDLLSAMDELRRDAGDNDRFLAAVRSSLYADIDDRLEESLLANRLLSALGAMIMASTRGSASTVINLNFDDLLEWYLEVHGFSVQTITDVPSLIDGRSDVQIYHLHGFLPWSERRSGMETDLVLTRKQYNQRISKDLTSPWNLLLLSILQSRVLLAVGTSMSDLDVAVTLEKARETIGEGRPLGFVIGTHNDRQAARLRDDALVPVTVSSYDEVPRLLLRVCQRAAEMHARSGG
jgi:hypothetical protein